MTVHFGNRILVARRALLALSLGAALTAGIAYAKNTSGVPVPSKPAFNKSNPVTFGTQLAKHAEKYDSGWKDSYSKGKMTLIDARGDSVKREVVQAVLEGQRGDKSLVRFMTPADIRGVAALTHEKVGGTDDSWLYLPASQRVRRISGANRTSSFQGTEFTYEDLNALSVERYSWKYLKDGTASGQKVFEVEGKPKYRDTGYSKLVVFLNITHFRPEKVVYYDKAGRKLKTLTSSSWKHHHGRFWRPGKQTMANHQTGKKTIIENTDMRVNMSLYPGKNGKKRANLSDSLFTRRALEGK
jgi:hypothetical protein